MSVARRVAGERREVLGGTVGYRISRESLTSKSTRCTFVTTGYFLATLVGSGARVDLEGDEEDGGGGRRRKPRGKRTRHRDRGPSAYDAFARYSHVILDEVHERDVDADFVSLLVRALLRQNPHVKLILMSATIEANQLGEYFADESYGSWFCLPFAPDYCTKRLDGPVIVRSCESFV